KRLPWWRWRRGCRPPWRPRASVRPWLRLWERSMHTQRRSPMEAKIYRKSVAPARTEGRHVRGTPEDRSGAWVPSSAEETRPLSPALFYPMVTEPEMVTWTHWLPTAIVCECTGALSPSEVTQTLTRLKAPPEVLEEFTWTWTIDLFEAYAVRTPVRRDAHGPLSLAGCG